ncbi:MAG: TIGR04283 family arsenosugar biosynthesis glycosyltransferase, partial [Terriglobia bacterium]
MSFRSSTISIIVPTYNEEEGISALLESLQKMKPQQLIIADGNSTDRTAEIAARFAKVVISPKGRGIQMNTGARESSADVLLFLHADVHLGPYSLEAIAERMRDPTILGGNFDVVYDGGDWAAAVFTCLNRWRRRAGIFYGDSGIFCRRHVFEALGGYRPWPVLEDYDFAQRLRKAGKLALLNEPVWVSGRRWRNAGILSTLWSWFLVQSAYIAGVPPE